MGPGMRWVQVRPQHGQASITLVNWFDTMPAGSVKGTVLEHQRPRWRRRRTAGPRGQRRRGHSDGAVGPLVTFDDPDGNGLILQASTPPGA